MAVNMAPTLAETTGAEIIIPKISCKLAITGNMSMGNELDEAHRCISQVVLTHEDTSDLVRLTIEVPAPIRDEWDYPTTGTMNSSSCMPSSTTPLHTQTSLKTIIISRTATITSTTIALITSESTIMALAPTEAPLLSTTAAKIVLSPGKIAGIVLGSITGLLLFVLLFYFLLTRAKWVARFSHYRLEGKEKMYRKQARRRPRRTTKPPENLVRKSTSARNTGNGK
ncbi:hypothetical protein HD806DRAFT_532853 [Xylariaceae sp. AK1471]|nr:hypothetical protein HD806DRAFT_532853 [Xylariaceae sp. AK1471]